MEKQLKDYLPFYMGCECQFIASGSEERRIEYGRIVEMPLKGTEWGLINSEYENHEVKCFAFYNDIKPILRPLSDMTIDEWMEAAKIHISSGGKVTITIDEMRKPESLAQYPEVFRYLLSKHFDLFGLIESGLAIDKTTTI